MADEVTIPSIAELLLPVLKATHDPGGSAARAELVEHVRLSVGLTDHPIAVVSSGPTGKSKALHRAEWAIYLLAHEHWRPGKRERAVYALTSGEMLHISRWTRCSSHCGTPFRV